MMNIKKNKTQDDKFLKYVVQCGFQSLSLSLSVAFTKYMKRIIPIFATTNK